MNKFLALLSNFMAMFSFIAPLVSMSTTDGSRVEALIWTVLGFVLLIYAETIKRKG